MGRKKSGTGKALGKWGFRPENPDGGFPLGKPGRVEPGSETEQNGNGPWLTEEEYHIFFESTALGIARIDSKMRFVGVNDSYCQLTGYSREELTNMTLHELLFAGSDVAPEDAVPATRVEMQYVRRDGSVIWVQVTHVEVRVVNGNPCLTTMFVENITERKILEEQMVSMNKDLSDELKFMNRLHYLSTLVVERGKLNDILEKNLEAAMVMTGAQVGNIRLLNREAVVLELIVEKGAIGLPLTEGYKDIAYDPDSCNVVLLKKRVILHDTRKPGLRETPILRFFLAEGIRTAQDTPLLSRSGEIVGILTTLHRAPHRYTLRELCFLDMLARQTADVILRIRAKEALQESEERYRSLAEELQAADARKNAFLGFLSHEIRNPLASIMLGMSLLERSHLEGEQAQKAKRIMGRQIALLSRIVDDLLDITRITHNKIVLQKEPVDLNRLAVSALEEYRDVFQARNITAEAYPAWPPVFIEADVVRLEQVMGNLLHNASKFIPSGGSVRLEVSKSGHNNLAVIKLKDSGIGMNSQTLDSLFQPFRQADNLSERANSGLGLGLALVKLLVELHGGQVTASSDGMGKGSEFTIYLPLSGQIAGTGKEHMQAVASRPGRRIMLIDDNKDLAETLRILIETEGYEVMLAYSGTEGLTKAREFLPEVLLCDIGLPDMDGYEVARVFNSSDELKDAYLGSLSGYARPEDLHRAKEAGFQCQLAKPVDFQLLKETLARIGETPSKT